jgi:hypothetical protein
VCKVDPGTYLQERSGPDPPKSDEVSGVTNLIPNVRLSSSPQQPPFFRLHILPARRKHHELDSIAKKAVKEVPIEAKAIYDAGSDKNLLSREILNQLLLTTSVSITYAPQPSNASQNPRRRIVKFDLRLQFREGSSGCRENYYYEDTFSIFDHKADYQCLFGHSLASRAGLCRSHSRKQSPTDSRLREAPSIGVSPKLTKDQEAREQQNTEYFIRSAFFTYMNKSTGTRPIPCKLSLNWDVPSFMEREFGLEETIDSIVTLTGNLPDIWAATCEQYITWRWPQVSKCVLKLTDKILTSYKNRSNGSYIDASTRIKFNVIAGRTLVLFGDVGLLAEVVEALAWICAALRPSHVQSVRLSSVSLEEVSTELGHGLVLSPQDVPRSVATADANKPEVGMCWRPLFPYSVVAYMFSSPERPSNMRGLEISLELMSHVCGLEASAVEDEHFLLLGQYTKAYAIREDSGNVQWHLKFRSEAEDVLDKAAFGNALSPLPEALLQSPNAHLLKKADRHFLGLWTEPQITLGTSLHDYSAIKTSACAEEVETLRKDGLALSGGLSFKGIITGTVSRPYKLGRHRKSPTEPRIWHERLLSAVNRPIILYSPSEKRAWLVSTLSVILHLIQARAAYYTTMAATRSESLEYDIPFCTAQADGGGAAYSVLVREKDRKVLKGYDKTLEQYATEEVWPALNFDDTDRSEHKITGSEIFGREFADIARSEQPLVLKRKRLGFFQSGWAHLLDGLVQVIFYEGFTEDVIKPDQSIMGTFTCAHWSAIPKQLNLMAASIPCVQTLSELCGCGPTMERVTSQCYWHCPRPLFTRCDHPAGVLCDRLQILTTKTAKLRHIKSPDTTELQKYPNGAVVFKYMDTRPLRANLASVAEPSDQITRHKGNIQFAEEVPTLGADAPVNDTAPFLAPVLGHNMAPAEASPSTNAPDSTIVPTDEFREAKADLLTEHLCQPPQIPSSSMALQTPNPPRAVITAPARHEILGVKDSVQAFEITSSPSPKSPKRLRIRHSILAMCGLGNKGQSLLAVGER